MFDPPAKQKPRRYQNGGVKQVGVSSTNEEHVPIYQTRTSSAFDYLHGNYQMASRQRPIIAAF